MSNAMHKYVSFLFLVVFVFISECVCGCIIITIHRVYSLLTSDSFCNTWEREKKDYNKSLPSHHQLRIKPSSHLWLYCSMTHTHTRTHTHWICLCAERNDKWAPRFSVARLALRVSGPSALTVSPVKKNGLSEQICLLCLAVNSTDAVNYTLFAASMRANHLYARISAICSVVEIALFCKNSKHTQELIWPVL